MDETLKYVKEQCYIYNRYNEASQTKGLMRAIENAQQVNRNLTYTKDEVTKDKLKTYAEEQKLTGIIIRKFIKIKDDKRNKRIYKKRIDNCILQLQNTINFYRCRK